MDLIWTIYGVVVFTFFVALIARFVLEWVQVLSRSWRPNGLVLVLAEAVYRHRSATQGAAQGDSLADPGWRATRPQLPRPHAADLVRAQRSELLLSHVRARLGAGS